MVATMRKRDSLKWAIAALLTTVGGCGEEDPKPGEEGGPCLVSFTPCNDGLSCVDGECGTSDAVEAREIDGRFVLEKEALDTMRRAGIREMAAA